MAGKGGIFESIRASIQSEEQLALQFMFPFKDRFKLLQSLTEYRNKEIPAWSVLGIFRRKYNSKLLKVFQEETNINKIAVDRKGRLEGSEIVAAVKRRAADDEE